MTILGDPLKRPVRISSDATLMLLGRCIVATVLACCAGCTQITQSYRDRIAMSPEQAAGKIEPLLRNEIVRINDNGHVEVGEIGDENLVPGYLDGKQLRADHEGVGVTWRVHYRSDVIVKTTRVDAYRELQEHRVSEGDADRSWNLGFKDVVKIEIQSGGRYYVIRLFRNQAFDCVQLTSRYDARNEAELLSCLLTLCPNVK